MLVRVGSTFVRFAASLAFAICSRSALDELADFCEGLAAGVSSSVVWEALALMIWSRSATDEVDTFRLVSGVFLGRSFRPYEGVAGAALAVPGGEMACPKMPATEGRGFGVRIVKLLLSDNGRGLGVLCRFEAGVCGFLIVDTGRDVGVGLVGVAVGVATLALTVRLPGTVMDSLLAARPNFLGVAGISWGGPSLVVGLLLLLDIADAGRKGGPMLLSALKKLDLRLVFVAAGEDGRCARLSTVLSESDGRDFFFGDVAGDGSISIADSGSGPSSWKPAREPALDEALDADLKASRLPRVSSSVLVFDVGVESGGTRD